MPNHVTHKLIFDAKEAENIFGTIVKDGNFDFNTLIPQPLHIYRGDISSDDEKDFPQNWFSWNKENWGTKWNAYQTKTEICENIAWIVFDTAWSIPYPIMAAFANKFHIPFEHRYFDEGHNFWGIERWNSDDSCDHIHRCYKRKNDDGDKRSLCIELKGYDPDDEDE